MRLLLLLTVTACAADPFEPITVRPYAGPAYDCAMDGKTITYAPPLPRQPDRTTRTVMESWACHRRVAP